MRRPLWPGVLVLAVSLGVAAGLAQRYRAAEVELVRLQAESGLVTPQRPAREIPKARLDEEAKSAETVVRSLTLPWAPLIGTIEKAATKEVAILQLQPDAETRVLRLTAETRYREAMFDFVRRLSSAQGLADVHLVSHQVQREDPQKPIQFSVQASLKEMR